MSGVEGEAGLGLTLPGTRERVSLRMEMTSKQMFSPSLSQSSQSTTQLAPLPSALSIPGTRPFSLHSFFTVSHSKRSAWRREEKREMREGTGAWWGWG